MKQLHFVALKGLLHNFHNTVDLSDSNRTNLRQLRDGLIALRDASCHNNRLLYLFGFANHADKCILGGVDNSAAVHKDQVSLVSIIDHLVAIFNKLSNHKLTV
jgi:hypothetical protein